MTASSWLDDELVRDHLVKLARAAGIAEFIEARGPIDPAVGVLRRMGAVVGEDDPRMQAARLILGLWAVPGLVFWLEGLGLSPALHKLCRPLIEYARQRRPESLDQEPAPLELSEAVWLPLVQGAKVSQP